MPRTTDLLREPRPPAGPARPPLPAVSPWQAVLSEWRSSCRPAVPRSAVPLPQTPLATRPRCLGGHSRRPTAGRWLPEDGCHSPELGRPLRLRRQQTRDGRSLTQSRTSRVHRRRPASWGQSRAHSSRFIVFIGWKWRWQSIFFWCFCMGIMGLRYKRCIK